MRLRCDNGIPANPILWDDATRQRPAVDQGATVAIEIGVFRRDIPLDLTGYTSFQLRLRPSAELVADLAIVPATLVLPAITAAAWHAGTARHLTAQLTPAETGYLLHTHRLELWCVLTALDPAGALQTLGMGKFLLVRSNSASGSGPAYESPNLDSLEESARLSAAAAETDRVIVVAKAGEAAASAAAVADDRVIVVAKAGEAAASAAAVADDRVIVVAKAGEAAASALAVETDRVIVVAKAGEVAASAAAVADDRAIVMAKAEEAAASALAVEADRVIAVTSATAAADSATQAATSVGGSATFSSGSPITWAADVDTTRLNLGLTTAGNALATLPDPSAIRFPRINADNTASALDALSYRAALGLDSKTAFSPKAIPNLILDMDARCGVRTTITPVGNGVQFISTRSPALSAAHQASFNMAGNSWCFAGWFTPTGAGLATLIGKNNRYLFSNSGFTASTGTTSVSAAQTPVLGTRYFVIGWYDSVAQTLNVQVDNNAPASVACTAGITDNASAVTVGATGGTPNGIFSNLMWLKRAPTAAEITALYNGGTPVPFASLPSSLSSDAALAAYWDLVTDYRDKTANAAHFTATNVFLAGVGGIAARNNDLVQEVIDQSGSGALVRQVNGAFAPTYIASGPYLRFTGTQNQLVVTTLPSTNVGAFTLFVVGKKTAFDTLIGNILIGNIWNFPVGGLGAGLHTVNGDLQNTAADAWPSGIATPLTDSVMVLRTDSAGSVLPFSGATVEVGSRKSHRRRGQNTSTIGTATATTARIGVTSLGGNYGQAFDYSRLLVYNRTLTDVEVEAVKSGLQTQVGTSVPATPRTNIIFLGDSITQTLTGTGVYTGYTDQVIATLGAKGINAGVSGQGTVQMLADVPAAVAAYDPDATRNIYVVFGGTNNMGAGSVTPFYNDLISICNSLRAAGPTAKVAVVTTLPRGASAQFETDRQALNTLVRTNHASFADGLVDAGADASIGLPGAQNNTVFFLGDAIHPNATGSLVLANLVLNSVLEF